MQKYAVCFLWFCVSVPGVAHGQVVQSPVGWEQFVRVGPHQYGSQTLTTSLGTVSDPYGNAQTGVPVVLDNNYVPNSPLNSGLLSMQIPAGGAVAIDTTPYTQSWGGAFSRSFRWSFMSCIYIFLVAYGLVFAWRYLANLFLTWGEK